MATLIAVLCPLVIDSIMGAIFRRAVLHRENCDSGGSGFSCNSNRPLGGVRSDLHDHTTFSHILHRDTYMSQDVSTTTGCSNASWGNVSHIRFVQDAAAISISDCRICSEIMNCVWDDPE